MSALSCAGLAFGHGGRPLCEGLSLELAGGQCWAVLGNNGCGKSTLLRTLAGLLPPLAGEIRLDGGALAPRPDRARARAVGLLLQEEHAAFWGSVLDYVLLGRYPHRHGLFGWSATDFALAHAAIERVDLRGRVDRPLSTLSGGERQRARLAQMLAQDAAVLLLDEPLQHLDLRHQQDTMALLRDLATRDGKALCMVLHDPQLAQRYCDHALLLSDDGRWQAGTREQLLRRDELERLYGCTVTLPV